MFILYVLFNCDYELLLLLLLTGVWTSHDELKAIRCTRALFQPKASIQEKYKNNLKEWRDAVNRSRNWYP